MIGEKEETTRRKFLYKLGPTALGAFILAACGEPKPTPAPTIPIPTATLTKALPSETATSSPTNTDTPTLEAPTATATAPKTDIAAGQIKYNISEGVSPEMRQEIITRTGRAVSWLERRTGINLGVVTVYADENPKRLIETYLEMRNDFSDERKRHERQALPNNTAWVDLNNDIYINTTSPGWTYAPPIIGGPIGPGREHTLAHELTHLIAIKFSAHTRNFPYWFWEGWAHYAAARELSENDIYPFKATHQGHTQEAAKMREPIQQLESGQEFSTAGSPYADEYSLATLAVEYLVRDLGQQDLHHLTKFWQIMGAGAPWQEAFANAFGQSVEDFYSSFEQYRQNGFQ